MNRIERTSFISLMVGILALLVAVVPAPCQSDEEALQKTIDRAVTDYKGVFGRNPATEVVHDLFVLVSRRKDATHKRAKGTVDRVYRALFKTYFKKRPTRPLRVYLFGSAREYDKYVEETTGRKPTTPYGYYSPSYRKMVMNIRTGTGTLAHEMVHPLIAEDFPEVPSWFNEGFASLFEQSYYTRDGSIRGAVNWRLRGLQPALRKGTAPSLREVMRTSTDEFYGVGSGLNYAVARYLCFYLQEQGKLVEYYKAFRAGVDEDPTGEATLKKVASKTFDELQKEWKAWVLALTYD
jgi:hypothetical protein